MPLRVSGFSNARYSLTWPPGTDQSRRTWHDLQEATELGATGVAVLLAKQETDHVVIERSVKGTGIDYWLGDASDAPLFQRKARLEISGILQGNDRAVGARVRQKLRQVARSNCVLPAFVVVVEFGKPRAVIEQK